MLRVAVDCVLETESAEEFERVRDRDGLINRLIPPLAEDSFQCWRFIDEYGDTIFNRQQMPQFLKELAIIRGRTTDPKSLGVLKAIEGLAYRCRDDVHLYVKFYGD
jgi:hypothetical protein